MDNGKVILSVLLTQLRDQRPWVTADELRQLLKESGIDLSKEMLSQSIEQLTKEGYLEIRAVDPMSLGRGFITRLTVPGKNKFVHSRSLTGN